MLTDSVSTKFLGAETNWTLNFTQIVKDSCASIHNKQVDLNLNIFVEIRFASISLVKIKHTLQLVGKRYKKKQQLQIAILNKKKMS